MDRRLAEHGQRLDALEDRVDFFVRTQTSPLQGVFYDGQLWDARALVLKLVASAKRSLILIDNWATAEVLDLFAKKRECVDAAGQTPPATAIPIQPAPPQKSSMNLLHKCC